MPQTSIVGWLKNPLAIKTVGQTTSPLAETPSDVSPHPPKSLSTDHGMQDVQPKRTERRNNAPAMRSSLPPLPDNVKFVPLSKDLIPSFKRLNAVLLPIPYPPIFYSESLTEPFHSITLMALWYTSSSVQSSIEQPLLVGAIRCRLLPSAILYISTIGLLAPYQTYGIATHLLHAIIAAASKEHGVTSVTAHVWEANEEGLEWYAKRGFQIIGREDCYYTKLKPSGALLLKRVIGPTDLLATTNAME